MLLLHYSMMSLKFFVAVFMSSFASATVHHLFVGTFSTHAIYALEFDDETYSLTLAANITTTSEHPWINLSVGAQVPRIVLWSYHLPSAARP